MADDVEGIDALTLGEPDDPYLPYQRPRGSAEWKRQGTFALHRIMHHVKHCLYAKVEGVIADRGAKALVATWEGVFAMDTAQLKQRLIRLEDIEAIKQLKARYCAIADEDHNPDKITTLFVEDGIWEGSFGTAQGHEAIRQLFQRAQQHFSFAHHGGVAR